MKIDRIVWSVVEVTFSRKVVIGIPKNGIIPVGKILVIPDAVVSISSSPSVGRGRDASVYQSKLCGHSIGHNDSLSAIGVMDKFISLTFSELEFEGRFMANILKGGSCVSCLSRAKVVCRF